MARKNKGDKKKSQLRRSLDDLSKYLKDSGYEKNAEIRSVKESNEQEIYDANYTAFKESLLERLVLTLEDKPNSSIRHRLKRKEDERYINTLINDNSFTSLYNIKINKDSTFDISIKSMFDKGEVDIENSPSEFLRKSMEK